MSEMNRCPGCGAELMMVEQNHRCVGMIERENERLNKYLNDERTRADDNRDLLAAAELRNERLAKLVEEKERECEGLRDALQKIATTEWTSLAGASRHMIEIAERALAKLQAQEKQEDVT